MEPAVKVNLEPCIKTEPMDQGDENMHEEGQDQPQINIKVEPLEEINVDQKKSDTGQDEINSGHDESNSGQDDISSGHDESNSGLGVSYSEYGKLYPEVTVKVERVDTPAQQTDQIFPGSSSESSMSSSSSEDTDFEDFQDFLEMTTGKMIYDSSRSTIIPKRVRDKTRLLVTKQKLRQDLLLTQKMTHLNNVLLQLKQEKIRLKMLLQKLNLKFAKNG